MFFKILLLSTLFISEVVLVGISLRYLSDYLDTPSLVFLRYLFGAMALGLYLAVKKRAEVIKAFQSLPFLFGAIGTSLLYGTAKYFETEALREMTYSSYSIVAILGGPLAICIGAMLYSNERQILQSKRFRLGIVTICSATFMNATAFAELPSSLSVSSVAPLFGLIAITCFTLGTLVLKQTIQEFDGVVTAFSIVFLQLLVYGVFAYQNSVISQVTMLQSNPVLVILILSGVVGSLSFAIIEMPLLKIIGAGALRTLILVSPAFALVFEYLFFATLPTVSSVVFGMIMMSGAYLILSGSTVPACVESD